MYYRVRDGRDANKHDFFLAFYIFCYDLKDWLVRDNIGSELEIEKYIQNNESLKLCGDIANFAKHGKLKKKKNGKLVSTSRTGDINTEVNEVHYYSISGGYFESTIKIKNKDKMKEPLQLMDDCMQAWASFLSSKNVSIPQTLSEIENTTRRYPFSEWIPK